MRRIVSLVGVIWLQCQMDLRSLGYDQFFVKGFLAASILGFFVFGDQLGRGTTPVDPRFLGPALSRS